MKMLPNTSLVRTVLQLSVGVRGYLPPHNFTVRSLAVTAWDYAPEKLGALLIQD